MKSKLLLGKTNDDPRNSVDSLEATSLEATGELGRDSLMQGDLDAFGLTR